jgi:hypothetical protein
VETPGLLGDIGIYELHEECKLSRALG